MEEVSVEHHHDVEIFFFVEYEDVVNRPQVFDES